MVLLILLILVCTKTLVLTYIMDLTRATFEQLKSIEGIGDKKAKAIISLQTSGRLSVEELVKATGLSMHFWSDQVERGIIGALQIQAPPIDGEFEEVMGSEAKKPAARQIGNSTTDPLLQILRRLDQLEERMTVQNTELNRRMDAIEYQQTRTTEETQKGARPRDRTGDIPAGLREIFPDDGIYQGAANRVLTREQETYERRPTNRFDQVRGGRGSDRGNAGTKPEVPKPRLDSFGGEANKWDPFIWQFKLVAETQGWDTPLQRQMLLSLIKDSVIEFIRHQPQERWNTMDGLVQLLETRYGSKEAPGAVRRQLQCTKQQGRGRCGNLCRPGLCPYPKWISRGRGVYHPITGNRFLHPRMQRQNGSLECS